MLLILLLVVPLLGVLWFINFTAFLTNLKNDKSTHNQILLGSALTFIFIFAVIYFYVGTVH